MAAKDRATEVTMRSKHPPANQPIGPLPTTNHDPIHLYSLDVFKTALKFKSGSAAGPSGLRPEHLRVVLQCSTTRRDLASSALTKLLNAMITGKIPDEVTPYFCGAQLHASKKRDGGLRPIAVGNLLRRLTSKCLAAAVADKAAGLLAPLQAGVGVHGGCEAIVHATKQALDENPEKSVLQADLINAFNVADRGTALQEVAEKFPEILSWCKSSYGRASLLVSINSIIESVTGFHQGDPLASLLSNEDVPENEKAPSHRVYKRRFRFRDFFF